MDEFNLARVINKLLPFLIFIGWIFATVISKKGRKQLPPPPEKKESNNPGYTEERQSPVSPAGMKSGGTWKKRLQSVLEELGVPLTEMATVAVEENEFSETAEDAEYTKRTVKTMVQKSASGAYKRQDEVLQEGAPQKSGRKTEQWSDMRLRQGIIWSEILSPPLSLRE